MALVKVTPTTDLRVRHENGKPLDPAGEDVEISVWWKRRELDGDVVIAEIDAQAEAAPAEAAPADAAPKAKK